MTQTILGSIIGASLFGLLLSKYDPVHCIALGISGMANQQAFLWALDRTVETCFSYSFPSSLKSENITANFQH
ncbi:hypothetical protein KY285_030214 [Solanum tuberosum]|nr:hypothetical protein KY285_030214 [Solanum tuberosum]